MYQKSLPVKPSPQYVCLREKFYRSNVLHAT